MITSKALGVTNLVAFTNAVNVSGIHGRWGGLSAGFVQLHDAATLPADGGSSVPVMVIPVAASSAFAFPQFESGGYPLTTGCVVAFSSQENFMAIQSGGGNTGNIFVQADDYEVPYTGTSSATSSASDSLTVWSSGGPKQLVKVTVTVGSGATPVYPLIFADSGFTQLVRVLNVHKYVSSADDKRVQAGETRVFRFGADGIDTSSVSSAGVLSNNCYIKLSTSPTAYSAPASVVGTSITALYK